MTSGSGVFKRAISNPNEMAKPQREGKISKVLESDVTSPPALIQEKENDGRALMNKLSLGDAAGDAAGVNTHMEGGDGLNNVDGFRKENNNQNVPVATITHHQSRASTSDSSLSDEDKSGDAAMIIDGEIVQTDSGSEEVGGRGVARGKFTRQVSNDDSLAKSDSSEGARQASVSGNWGLFVDHDSLHISDSTKKLRGLLDSDADDAGNNDKGGSNKKKKGGLLSIGSEILQQALFAIVEPQRGELSPISVGYFFRKILF